MHDCLTIACEDNGWGRNWMKKIENCNIEGRKVSSLKRLDKCNCAFFPSLREKDFNAEIVLRGSIKTYYLKTHLFVEWFHSKNNWKYLILIKQDDICLFSEFKVENKSWNKI